MRNWETVVVGPGPQTSLGNAAPENSDFGFHYYLQRSPKFLTNRDVKELVKKAKESIFK